MNAWIRNSFQNLLSLSLAIFEPLLITLASFLEIKMRSLLKSFKIAFIFIFKQAFKIPFYWCYYSLKCIFVLVYALYEDIHYLICFFFLRLTVLFDRRIWRLSSFVKVFLLFFYFIYPIYIILFFCVLLYLILFRYCLIVFGFIILYIREITEYTNVFSSSFKFLEQHWFKVRFYYFLFTKIIYERGLWGLFTGYVRLWLLIHWYDFKEITLFNFMLSCTLLQAELIIRYQDFYLDVRLALHPLYYRYIAKTMNKLRKTIRMFLFNIYIYRYAILKFLINIGHHMRHTFIPIFLNYCYYIGFYYGVNFIYFFLYYIYIIFIYSLITLVLFSYWFNILVYYILYFIFYCIKLYLYNLSKFIFLIFIRIPLGIYLVIYFILYNILHPSILVIYGKILYKDCLSIINYFKLKYSGR